MDAQTIIESLRASAKRDTRDRTVETLNKMKGLLVSTLDRWVGEDKRRWIYAAVFEKQSTRALTPAEIATLLDWCGLERDELTRQYSETEQSDKAKREIEIVLAWYQTEHGQVAMQL